MPKVYGARVGAGFIEWNKTAQRIALGIAGGCTMCKTLDDYFKTGYMKSSLYDKRGEIKLHIYYMPDDRQFMVGIFPVDENGQSENNSWLSYKLAPGSVDDPCVGVVPGVGIENFTPSREHFQNVRVWMDDCQRNHTKCKAQNSNFKPTRLLEVIPNCHHGDTQATVRLVSGRECSGDYTTLSYCWGRSNYRTTTENLEQHMDCILVSQLPRTIQDAIVCASRLNLRYLWVDALCIVQDCESEVAQEISLMSRIYRNSYVTITAALATDSDQGFLHDREFVSAIQGEIVPRLPFRCSSDVMGSVGLLKFTVTRFRDPIVSRGWTFQEQMMSPRLLVYGTLGVYWQCLERSEPEEQPSMGSAGRLSRGWIVRIRQALHTQDPSSLLTKDDSEGDRWEKIVEEYSSRELTYPHDKLSALSPIAAAFGRPDSRYVAGLWADRLVRYLLWRSQNPDSASRLSSTVAPSWSWASLAGNIIFNFSPQNPSLWNELVEVVSCGATPKYAVNSYGETIRAWLVVRGYISTTEVDINMALARAKQANAPPYRDTRLPIMGDYLDSAKEQSSTSFSVFTMPLVQIDKNLVSLLLIALGPCFKRIGIRIAEFGYEDKQQVNNGKKETVELR
ncbi:heterokaryon incompatibility protein-domain-containing protein [Xylaria curta]|nr:heterokaryon incompatibility protein-domain-containing protein [Xylaria curta]